MSRRKKKHEEHQNHEAWAIPYGDLVTLLLALFVVMYAVSSINEGKFRVLSEAMSVAFGGAPKTLQPIQFGEQQMKGTQDHPEKSMMKSLVVRPDFGVLRNIPRQDEYQKDKKKKRETDLDEQTEIDVQRATQSLVEIKSAVSESLQGLIEKKMIIIRQKQYFLEIEIKTDILFSSGSSKLQDSAIDILNKLAVILKPFPNVMRIEGYTDNRPINSIIFPSNWELSAARAASVVHLFMNNGIEGEKLMAAGFGEYRPLANNGTEMGRNQNRRVVVVVLSNVINDNIDQSISEVVEGSNG